MDLARCIPTAHKASVPTKASFVRPKARKKGLEKGPMPPIRAERKPESPPQGKKDPAAGQPKVLVDVTEEDARDEEKPDSFLDPKSRKRNVNHRSRDGQRNGPSRKPGDQLPIEFAAEEVNPGGVSKQHRHREDRDRGADPVGGNEEGKKDESAAEAGDS
jgi:hypothetical protein